MRVTKYSTTRGNVHRIIAAFHHRRAGEEKRAIIVCVDPSIIRAPFPGIVRPNTCSVDIRVFNVFNEDTFAPLAKHFETAHKLSICDQNRSFVLYAQLKLETK